jgi:hypothetical protein
MKPHRYAISFGSVCRHIARCRGALLELSLAYALISVGLTALARLSPWFLAGSLLVYLAFGSMISTVLEERADPAQGSGLRLLLRPGMWRRNGLPFRVAVGLYGRLTLFAVGWMIILLLLAGMLGAGSFRVSAEAGSAFAGPQIHPGWLGLLLLLLTLPPVAYLRERFVRHADINATPSHPPCRTDRILWYALLSILFLGYVSLRAALMRLPFPVGPILGSSAVALFTIFLAACELRFIEAHRTLAGSAASVT